MYAYVSSKPIKRRTDFQVDEKDINQIFQWRKHPNLHGWMENLYYRKGGKSDSFNCVTLRLDLKDLKELELAIREHSLPLTEGFFFGQSENSEDQIKRDLQFVQKAMELVYEGKDIFYSSWW